MLTLCLAFCFSFDLSHYAFYLYLKQSWESPKYELGGNVLLLTLGAFKKSNGEGNNLHLLLLLLLSKHLEGHLVGSVSRACDSQSQGNRFKPYIGHGAYFKKKNNTKKERENLKRLILTPFLSSHFPLSVFTRPYLGLPGWLIWLSIHLLILAQAMISNFVASSPMSDSADSAETA